MVGLFHSKNMSSSRNRTLVLSSVEEQKYLSRTQKITAPVQLDEIINSTLHQDVFSAIPHIPDASIDLAIIDPPYNLSKDFGTVKFKQSSDQVFYDYTKKWVQAILPKLKKTASIYVCCDWKSTAAIYSVLSEFFMVQNRITWQREKGRGAKTNWKNGMEDIWFATVSKQYHFDVEAVKVKRKVIAPYRENGVAKDWQTSAEGDKYRMTHPSNFWDDITIPFWSMPENTPHPTQKPEKLIAKLILASSKPGDVIFDCFLGSGTTSVVAKKLDRKYIGIEIDPVYAALAEKRLEMADTSPGIQGYSNGVFWERNSQPYSSQSKSVQQQKQP